MVQISQNKKVAIAAISIFLVSLSFMLIFFDKQDQNMDFGHTDVLSSNHDDLEQLHDGDFPLEIYKSYLETSSEPWLVTNSAGIIQYTSDEFCNLMNVDTPELEGKLIFDYINAKDLSKMVSINTSIIQSVEKIERFGPYRMISGDNEILVLFTAYPVTDDDGLVHEIIYSLNDITAEAEELTDGAEKAEKNDIKYRIQDLYPSIQDTKDVDDTRLMVDHISYSGD